MVFMCFLKESKMITQRNNNSLAQTSPLTPRLNVTTHEERLHAVDI